MSSNRSMGDSSEVQKLTDEMMMTVLPVTVYIGVEAVIGFFGNILILLVYSQYYDKSNFRIFVLFMAKVDLTSCMTTLPLEMFSQINWYTYHYGWMCSVKTFFNVYTAWGSASILILLAYDRNRKICRPLGEQILPPKAMKMCIGAVILSLCIAAPVLPLWGKQTYVLEANGMNLTVSVCEKSNEFKDTIYPFAYILSVYVIPMALCVLVLMVLNIMTVWELFGKNKSPSLMNSINVTHGSKSSLSTLSLDTVTSFDDTPTYRKSPNSPNPSVGISDYMARNTRSHKNVEDLKRSVSCDMIDVRTDSGLGIHKPEKDKTGQPCFTLDVPFTLGTNEDVGTDVFGSHTTGRVFPGSSKGIYRVNSDDVLGGQSIKRGSFKSHVHGLVHPTSSSSFVSNKDKKMEAMKRKTRIMLVLTSVFALTMSTYVSLTFCVSLTDGILKNLGNSGKVTFFFFWRLYFMNTIINPILYGVMDPRFRSGLAVLTKQLCRPCFPWSKS